MEFVAFKDVRDKMLNDIKRHSLVPIVGSGFSRGCRTRRGGVVPSGEEYKKYMLKEIEKSMAFSKEEMREIDSYSFSQVSEIYNSQDVISVDKRRNYLIDNFLNVIINDDNKINFLNLPWKYIYTLNIDDAIEKNSNFSQVVYANRDIYDDIFSTHPSVIKLHGDVDDIVKYKDSHCEIFDAKQYAVSIETNSKLLQFLKHDFEYQNIIFVGCSLSDEIDLAYLSSYGAVSLTNRYYCYVGELSRIDKIKLIKFGVTHCVKFDNFASIYTLIIQLFEESNAIQTDELDSYIGCKYSTIDSGYELNSKYLFEGKSPLESSTSILLPNYFINRRTTKDMISNFDSYPLQILCGQGCSGRTYIGIEISSLIRDRNVYFFESKNSLTYTAFRKLLHKNDSIVIIDENVLSNSQIELLLKSLSEIRSNNMNVILIAKNNDRDLPGLIRYAINKGTISENDIKRVNIDNTLSIDETKKINSLLVNSSLGVFYEDRSLVDNIICCANELSVKNRFTKLIPKSSNVRQLVCLILLAIKRKVYSRDVVLFDLEEEMNEQCKQASPLIEQDYTKQYEIDSDNNSPIKYIVNAEYWLCDFLSSYVNDNKRSVIDAFGYIVKHIVSHYGKPDISSSEKDAPYKDFILFDNISYIFKKQANMFVIKDIYESLNDDLSVDPNYIHQRAKCYIRLSDIAKTQEEKIKYLTKAFYDSNSAYSVFDKRFYDTKNDKVFISSSHALYTKALCMCHLCNINNFSDKSQNTATLKVLIAALQLPYNTYKRPSEDRYNYGDVVMKFATTIMSKSSYVEENEKKSISQLFDIIRKNKGNSSY